MHITEFLLEALARGEVTPEFVIEVLAEHIDVTRGEERQGAHERKPGRARAWSDEQTRDPVARFGRRMGWGEWKLQKEVKAARRDVRDIVKLSHEDRCKTIEDAYSRFQGPLFGTLLLEKARRKIPAEPAAALELAEAALVSSKVTRRYATDPAIQTAALAVRGNAKRALGRLLEANTDLEEARRLLFSEEVQDPEVPAEVFSYLGSLRKDQGKLDEAALHLHRAGTFYRLLEEPEKAARVLMKLSAVRYRAQELDGALQAAEEALKLLPPGAEEWLRAYGHYNVAHRLHACGELDRAEAELAAHEELLAAGGGQLAQMVVWLRARIAWSRDDVKLAERLYTEALRQARQRGIAFDTSQVSLELALVYLTQGRTAWVKKLAIEALEVFAEQEVEREIRAALDLIKAAALRDAITRELLERAITALERARHSPRAKEVSG